MVSFLVIGQQSGTRAEQKGFPSERSCRIECAFSGVHWAEHCISAGMLKLRCANGRRKRMERAKKYMLMVVLEGWIREVKGGLPCF